MPDKMRPGIGCLLMAAGNASRFAANKLLSPFHGKLLIEWALEAIPAPLFHRVTVVTQYPQVEQLARQAGFAVIRNTCPEKGVSHTIHLGVGAMEDCDGILFLVADQPMLRRASVERVAAAWQAQPDRIVSAACGLRRGNPCVFPRRFFEELMCLQGDRGGSTVIRAHPDALQLVELPEQELADCDTQAALAALEAYHMPEKGV